MEVMCQVLEMRSADTTGVSNGLGRGAPLRTPVSCASSVPCSRPGRVSLARRGCSRPEGSG